jgi:hypothetical protein
LFDSAVGSTCDDSLTAKLGLSDAEKLKLTDAFREDRKRLPASMPIT